MFIYYIVLCADPESSTPSVLIPGVSTGTDIRGVGHLYNGIYHFFLFTFTLIPIISRLELPRSNRSIRDPGHISFPRIYPPLLFVFSPSLTTLTTILPPSLSLSPPPVYLYQSICLPIYILSLSLSLKSQL